MAISQRVYVTNMTCGMFSGAFSLYWLRARARGTSLPLSLLHIHRPPMNTFCKDEEGSEVRPLILFVSDKLGDKPKDLSSRLYDLPVRLRKFTTAKSFAGEGGASTMTL